MARRRADALASCGGEFLSEANMVQTTNRFFDEVARLMNDAAGVAQGVRREAETLFRTQAERILRDLAVVQREEFEAVKDMARLAREENEALKARIAALEARLAGSNAAAGGPGATSAPPGPGGPQQPPGGYFA
jgi:BMFP domain-containing protein YqiC